MKEIPKDFKQVAILEGVIIKENEAQVFEQFFQDKFGIKIKYLETVETLPDKNEKGEPVEGTGGRKDVFFAIHNDDVMKFAVPRFKIGARWLEDAVANINNPNGIIYPKHVLEYVTWNKENIEMD